MLAVVATRTESLISRACFTASTYPLVAASCAPVGSVTFTILELFTSTVPDPLGLSETLPLVLVLEISLPLRVRLSTSIEVRPFKSVLLVPRAIASVPIVTLEFANCVLDTAPEVIVTTPLETVKSALAKDAIPLFEVVANSPAIVIVLSLTVVSIPSPPVNVNVCPVLNVSLLPESAASVKLDVTVPKLNCPELAQ